MAKLEIKCSAEYLLLVSKFVSRETHRFYLNGVNIEKHPTKKGVVITATDGHRLASMYDEDGRINGAASAIIAVNQDMARALRHKKANEFHQRGNVSHVLYGSNTEDINIDEIGDAHLYTAYNKPIEGTFPDWRRVVPKTFGPVKSMTFNHEYVRGFTSLLPKGEKSVTAFFSGDENSPVVFRLGAHGEKFIGVLMPMRGCFHKPLPEFMNG